MSGRSILNKTLDSVDTAEVELRSALHQRFTETEQSRHKFLSEDGKFIYHVGIIDYLQDFNIEKKLENFFKQYVKKKGNLISAVPPSKYAERFLRFMRDEVIVDQKLGKGKQI